MIKKLQVNQIQPPSDPPPSEYFLNRNDRLPSGLKEYEDLDLRRLPSLKLMMKDLKASEMLNSLEATMSRVMEIEKYGGKTESMKKEIVIYVMEEIEKFLLKPKSGSEKKQIAIAILKPMFHNDEVIAGIAIDGLMKFIKQVGVVRRLFLKAYRYFRKKSS